jgi:hypothetical protein
MTRGDSRSPRNHDYGAPGVLLALTAGAVLVIGALGEARSPQAGYSATAMTSAEECARCHVDIHRYWKASRHAQAADSPRFQALLEGLRSKGTPEPVCVRCHAPAAVFMRDTRWEKKASWEGVTCDFCHSVRGIRNDPAMPFVLEVGRVKTGPLKDATPTTHAAQFAEVYTSSELCAPCHQFVNDKGFEVLSTYAEWKASGYPQQNVTCQTCHMRAAGGNVVDPKVMRVSGTSVNLHEMPGGHSVVELNRALQAQISAARRGDTLDVTVQFVNRGAGHRVPTGSPLRAIVMVVSADGAVGQRQTATRTYARVVVDENGQDLADEASVWLKGRRVVRDDRIAPGERRVERFSFRMSPSLPAHATARFFYRYMPDAAARGNMGQPFLTVGTWVDVARD